MQQKKTNRKVNGEIASEQGQSQQGSFVTHQWTTSDIYS